MPADRDTRQRILDAAQRIIAHRGWAAVGINEVLGAAAVPKGSFYHWFSSKDALGEAMLSSYFASYVAEMDEIFAQPEVTAAARLMNFWTHWRQTQSLDDYEGRCLAVKLGAEVSDLSEPMRLVLKAGTTEIVDRIEKMIQAGITDHSLSVEGDARAAARALYDLWLGASVMAKIHRDPAPMDDATTLTRRTLHL